MKKNNFVEHLIETVVFNKQGGLDLGQGSEGQGEGQAQGEQQTQGQENKPTFSPEDFEKYQKILDERVASLEKNIAKSNVGGDQTNDFIEAFKEYQKSKQPDTEVLTKEIETLRQQIRDRDANETLKNEATAANLSENGFKALMKLADKNSIFEKDGKISSQKTKEIIDNFVKEFPEFVKKAEQNDSNFFISGAKKQGQEQQTNTQEDLFKNAFAYLNRK